MSQRNSKTYLALGYIPGARCRVRAWANVSRAICSRSSQGLLEFSPSSQATCLSEPHNLFNVFSPSSSTFLTYIWKKLVTTLGQRGLRKSRLVTTQQLPPHPARAEAPPLSHLFTQEGTEGLACFLFFLLFLSGLPSFLLSFLLPQPLPLSFLLFFLPKIPVRGGVTSSLYRYMPSI